MEYNQLMQLACEISLLTHLIELHLGYNRLNKSSTRNRIFNQFKMIYSLSKNRITTIILKRVLLCSYEYFNSSRHNYFGVAFT